MPPGGTINIDNPDSVDHNVIIYEIPDTDVSTVQFTLQVEEQDSGGTVLYSGSVTITEIPPTDIQVVAPGSVTIDALG